MNRTVGVWCTRPSIARLVAAGLRSKRQSPFDVRHPVTVAEAI